MRLPNSWLTTNYEGDHMAGHTVEPATHASGLDRNTFLAGLVILLGTVLASTFFIAWSIGADLLFPLYLLAVSASATVALVATALREDRDKRTDPSPDGQLPRGEFEPTPRR